MPTFLKSPSLNSPGRGAGGKKASLWHAGHLAYLVSELANGTIKLHCFLESYCHSDPIPDRRNTRKGSMSAPDSAHIENEDGQGRVCREVSTKGLGLC